MMKKLFLLLIIGVCSASAIAQIDLTTVMLPAEFMPEAARMNPAALPTQGIAILLPKTYFDIQSTTNYNDLFTKNSAGKTTLDLSNAIAKLQITNNQLSATTTFQTLGVTFGVGGGWSLSLDHAVRSNTEILYSKAAADIFWNGNAAYIGQTADIGVNLQSSTFSQFSIAAAYQLGYLKIGGRAKYLNGISNVSTSRSTASLNTSSDIYQLTLNTDYQLNTSNYLNKTDLDNFDFKLTSPYSLKNLFTPNRGLAFDLGIDFDLTEKLKLSASVTDLAGNIKWTQNAQNLSSKGTYTYSGLDLAQVLRRDSVNFSSTLDTLSKIFNFQKTNNSYTSTLPTNYLASLQYKLSDRLTVGAVAQVRTHQGLTQKAIAASAGYKIFSFLHLGATYSFRDGGLQGLGLSAVAKIWKFRFFALTDNILTFTQPYGSSFANGRVGMNFVIQ